MKISFRKSEREMLADIRNGDDKLMEEIYLTHRKEFVSWSIGNFGITEDDALDHYQDTVTIFFEKVMNGSLVQIDSTIKTYLFGIGKNRLRQHFESSSREAKHEEGLAEHYQFLAKDESSVEAYELARSQTKKLFETLGKGCKEILKLFYYEKKSMKEIASILGHKSESVSRTTKKRCVERLRDEVNKPLTNG